MHESNNRRDLEVLVQPYACPAVCHDDAIKFSGTILIWWSASLLGGYPLHATPLRYRQATTAVI